MGRRRGCGAWVASVGVERGSPDLLDRVPNAPSWTRRSLLVWVWSVGRWISQIVSQTLCLGLEDVHWFVMGSDNTVFIIENLVLFVGIGFDLVDVWFVGFDLAADVECCLCLWICVWFVGFVECYLCLICGFWSSQCGWSIWGMGLLWILGSGLMVVVGVGWLRVLGSHGGCRRGTAGSFG